MTTATVGCGALWPASRVAGGFDVSTRLTDVSRYQQRSRGCVLTSPDHRQFTCPATCPYGGHRQASKGTKGHSRSGRYLCGNDGNSGDCGSARCVLITQRSLVQIQPPQP